MEWLKAQKLWFKAASQREWGGQGGVGLPAAPRTVTVWDVLSPPRFGVCPPSPEPTPFTFLEYPLPKDG